MNFSNFSPSLKTFGFSFLATSCLISLASIPSTFASDHIDSPSVSVAGPVYDPLKAAPTVGSGKPEDIADVYVFREGDQTGNPADNTKMVLVLTTNGLIPPGQSRPFSPDVEYQIKVSNDALLKPTAPLVDNNGVNLEATAKTLKFRFGSPDANGIQSVYLNNGAAGAFANIGNTTAFAATPNVINTTYAGQPIKVFTGESDDPFFLDFRAVVEGIPFGVGVAPSTNTARIPGDSFGNSNVNSIVVSIPMAAFQTVALETKFHVWGATVK